MSMPVTFISFDVLTEFIFGEECHKLQKIVLPLFMVCKNRF